MPREAQPLWIPDLPDFARALATAWRDRQAAGAEPPGHVETLNLIARALGHRNLQALQAAAATRWPDPATEPDRPPLAPVLTEHARKALGQFDSRGRLARWPNKLSVQRLAMWILWTHFDGRRSYTEAEVNTLLRGLNAFGDHVTLRRELVNHHLLTRRGDGSVYRKLPAEPDAEARALLQAWRLRRHQPPPARPARPARPRPTAGDRAPAA